MSRVLYRHLIQLSQLCIHELVRKFGIAVIVGATAPPISIGIAIRPLIVTQQNQNRFGCGGCLEMDGDLPVLSRIDSGRCSVTLQFPKNPFRRCFRRRADFRISFIGNLFVKLGQLLHRIRKPRRTLIELLFGGGPLNLRIQRNRLKTRTETMPYGMRRNEVNERFCERCCSDARLCRHCLAAPIAMPLHDPFLQNCYLDTSSSWTFWYVSPVARSANSSMRAIRLTCSSKVRPSSGDIKICTVTNRPFSNQSDFSIE